MYVNVTCLSYYEMPDILTYMLLLKIDKFSGVSNGNMCSLLITFRK